MKIRALIALALCVGFGTAHAYELLRVERNPCERDQRNLFWRARGAAVSVDELEDPYDVLATEAWQRWNLSVERFEFRAGTGPTCRRDGIVAVGIGEAPCGGGAFGDALARVGLAHLAPMLDRSSRWDHELNGDEQQKLMLARLLIHRPRWVVLDDLLDALDDATRARTFDIFASELEGSAVIYIGRSDAADASFTRVLHIGRDPGDRRMVRQKSAAVPPSEMEAAAAS